MESFTFFGVSVEYFGVFQRLFGDFVLISFRSYAGILSMCCAVYCNRGINVNSILSVEKVRESVFKRLRPT